jgi:hypothetical protein
MSTEIPQKNWQSFCERLNKFYRGAMSIRLLLPDGNTRLVAQDASLQTVIFKKQNDSCNDLMTIEAGPPNERPLQHQIIEPIRVVLRKDAESGRYNRLEILAENGLTEITFHPGSLEELVA